MNKLFYILIGLLVFFSCKKESKYPGYSKHASGAFYKLLAFTDSEKKPAEGNYLEMHLIYKTLSDSLLSDSKKQNPIGAVIIPYKKDSLGAQLTEMFSMLNEGDSVSFIIKTETVFENMLHQETPENIGEEMKMYVMLKRILTTNEYKNRINELTLLTENMDVEEQRLLNAYLKNFSVETMPIGSGFYYLPIVEGSGPAVENDKIADIYYKGYFLNGEVFDSTNTGIPFEYFVGVEDQLIKGLEEGLTLMKEGGKAKFILPSHLAYGDKGSSAGIVPPYTTVIYEVEVLKVN